VGRPDRLAALAGQPNHPHPPVLAGRDLDQAPLGQGLEVAGERGAVEREGIGQPRDRHRLAHGHGDQQRELGDPQATRPEGLVVELGDGPGGPAQVLAGAAGRNLGELRTSRRSSSHEKECIYT
jgi:hypothetical protein